MSKIWAFMIILAIFFSVFLGCSDKIIEYTTSGCENAIKNIITLSGMLCFWSGIFNILKHTNLINSISKITSPIISTLFNKDEINEDVLQDISLNVTSNALGVGNAATVFGINAIEKMQELNKNKQKPNDSMCVFILINTASIQIIPTTMISLRAAYGSSNPGKIILPVWIVSIISLTIGIIVIKVLNRVVK